MLQLKDMTFGITNVMPMLELCSEVNDVISNATLTLEVKEMTSGITNVILLLEVSEMSSIVMHAKPSLNLCSKNGETTSNAMHPLEVIEVTSGITSVMPKLECHSEVNEVNARLLPEVTEATSSITNAMSMMELCWKIKKTTSESMLPLGVFKTMFDITNAMTWDFEKELANTFPYYVPAIYHQVLPVCLPNLEEGS